MAQLLAPWFADIVNYLVIGQMPMHWTKQKSKFLVEIKHLFWDDSYLFKYYPDQIIRRCIHENDQQSLISFCHDHACGGHFSARKTAAKILLCGFYWPSIFHDSFTYCSACEQCQRLGSLSRRNMMPLNPIFIFTHVMKWYGVLSKRGNCRHPILTGFKTWALSFDYQMMKTRLCFSQHP